MRTIRNVLIILPSACKTTAEKMSYELLSALEDLGYNTVPIVDRIRDCPAANPKEFNFLKCKNKKLNFFATVINTLKLCFLYIRKKIDLVIVADQEFTIPMVYAAKIQSRAVFVYIKKQPSKYDLKYRSLDLADSLILCANSFKKFFIREGVLRDKVKILSNFLPDYQIDFLSCITKKDFIQKINCSKDNPKIILQSGSIFEHKGHRTLIEAIRQLKESGLNVIGVISVRGYAKDKITEKILKTLIKQSNLGDDIFIIEDILEDELMKISDIYVQPSFEDGLPISVLKAASHGLPIVAGACEGLKDLIDDKKGGFLFNPSNVNELIEILKGLLEKEQDIAQLVEYTKEKLLRENSRERFLEDLRNIINSKYLG